MNTPSNGSILINISPSLTMIQKILSQKIIPLPLILCLIQAGSVSLLIILPTLSSYQILPTSIINNYQLSKISQSLSIILSPTINLIKLSSALPILSNTSYNYTITFLPLKFYPVLYYAFYPSLYKIPISKFIIK